MSKAQKAKKNTGTYKIEPQEITVYVPLPNGYVHSYTVVRHVKVRD